MEPWLRRLNLDSQPWVGHPLLEGYGYYSCRRFHPPSWEFLDFRWRRLHAVFMSMTHKEKKTEAQRIDKTRVLLMKQQRQVQRCLHCKRFSSFLLLNVDHSMTFPLKRRQWMESWSAGKKHNQKSSSSNLIVLAVSRFRCQIVCRWWRVRQRYVRETLSWKGSHT